MPTEPTESDIPSAESRAESRVWRWAAPLALLLGLALTLLVWQTTRQQVQAAAQLQFNRLADHMRIDLQARLDLLRRTTRGGAAFYSTSPKVDDDLFRDYVRALNLPLHQPGVMGLGYATWKPRADIASLQRRMVAEGLTDFRIRPASSGSHVSAILYLEPLTAANRRAIGYDMSTNPVRRAAMQSARDSGEAALSGMVELVQDQLQPQPKTTPTSIQAKPEPSALPRTMARPGFLLYMPVFHHGQPRATPAARAAALRGWVYMPVRAQDLIDHLPSGQGLGTDFTLRVRDLGAHGGGLLYSGPQAAGSGAFQETLLLDFSGRRWALHFVSLPAFERAQRNITPPIILASGLGLTLLLGAVLDLLRRGRERAQKKALRMTQDLRRSDMAMRDSLKQKDLLLHEIHHRVKNNLQVVHSLLDLQADTITDGETLTRLRDAQARVRAMALIHQVLYQSHDFAQVDFGNYLELLLGELRQTLGHERIRVSSEVQPVTLDLKTAIPCGLLTSEAVSNAFKHAFPQGHEGMIHVRLSHTPAGVELSVADNGVGLAPGWKDKATLGMRLIELLAEQCGGKLTIHTGVGTRIVVVLPPSSGKSINPA